MLELSIIVIIIILSLIFFKIRKIIWKTILFTLLVILIIIGVTGYLVYKDVQEIINNENIILITSEQGVQTGAIVYKGEEFNTNYFNEQDLIIYSEYLKNDDYKSALGDRALLIILNTSMFNNLDRSISINGQEFPIKEGVDSLMSNVTSEFIDKATGILKINMSIINKDEMIEYKFKMTPILVGELVREEGGTKTLSQNTKIYPERLVIKILKQTPYLIKRLFPE